ncbi:putative repressor in the phenylacetic acid catabolism [Planomonospora parontospora subsp. parontospora]|uniref:Repressor in the phenylacetic acid catabolism n=2 Tax=Planomonospora parontospora TaxID=58119 RepID=A0AA37F5M8_9ACTN|nr:PaaX family transcriptional regulator C-terminal domain-containing protein [Planomonospora parontospora]GGK77076.1 putative repressor in the phenylacetic acid catabolism [Planomonospora parontospora]GII10050.1 putative repressor in the phenylacetic acid catabolism [Planomonospora parontospora subsp. parontospora]
MTTTRRPQSPGSETPRAEVPTRTLVYGLVRRDGTVHAGELYAVAEILGMSDQQVRLCIGRLTDEGRFTREGRGRKAVLRATAGVTNSPALTAGFVRHAFRQDRGLQPWDGLWHLVAFAVPESARAARDGLREAILRLGGAPLHNGLYVSAHPWEDLVETEAHRLGLAPALTHLTCTHLRMGGEHDPRALAASLWPLQEIAAGYERLAEVTRPRLHRVTGPEPLTRTEVLAIEIELAAELTRAMDPDPLLPPELLPADWPGGRARAAVADCWTALRDRHDGEAPPVRLFELYDEAAEAADP